MICYDIADNRARREVEKILRGVGERTQWSVFECFLTPASHEQLRRELATLIEPVTDSVRHYPLCNWCEKKIHWHGRGVKSEDPDLWIV